MKMIPLHIGVLIALLSLSSAPALWAQAEGIPSGRITPKELNIPASPIFDLMGVTPSVITRTSDIKDFKVDWSFKSWKLNPNLALQTQPIWELLYNRKSVEKYQNAKPFMRLLSSLDLSMGTVQNEENDRRIGVAVKINLLNKKDPLLARDLYADIDPKYQSEELELKKQIAELQHTLDTTSNILAKPPLRDQIKAFQEQLMTLNQRRRAEINGRAQIYVAEYWNAPTLSAAAGRIYTYRTDSAGSLLKMRLNRNTGWGYWLNGGFGAGKKIFISGLFRTTFYEEELNFLLQDNTTGEQFNRQAIASNHLYTFGVNLRYGGPLFTFFAEFIHDRKALKTAGEALDDVFKVPAGSTLVPASVKWDIVHPTTISFGGDWRVGQNIILNYGMRCIYDKTGKLKTFTPVVTFSCLMR